MRRDNNQQKIALAVGIALSAGMFSIMPSAYGAPVHDADSALNTGAAVDQTGAAAAGGVLTKVTGNNPNNVVAWKDFSVGKTDEVQFTNTNNYMNVVTGAATSQIDGKITGGGNVYIVNPNGVIFGKDASVNVGSLYVSTKDIPTDKTTAVSAMSSGPATVLQAGTANADVVNMGKINAINVQVVGKNIKFTDVSQVTASDVTLNASGSITLGGRVTDLLATKDDTSTNNVVEGYKNTVGAEGKVKYDATINDIGDWKNLPKLGYDKDNTYVLTDNLDFSADTTYTLIGDNTNSFKGTFDGQFHTISGITVSGVTYGGLFGYTEEATIKNVGLTGSSAISATSFAGGIVGYADKTKFYNVYNTASVAASTSNGKAGGIAGYAQYSEIDGAYNTGTITGKRHAGIVGEVSYTAIDNTYNTNKNTEYGIVYVTNSSESDSVTVADVTYNKSSLAHSYTESSKAAHAQYSGTGKADVITNASSKNVADYGKLGSISNKGYDGTNPEDNTVWRIYEGQSLPFLRAFLTANGVVNVDYNYTHGGTAVQKGASDDLAVTYNGSNITLADVTFTKGGEAISTGSIIKPSEIPTELDGNVIGLDSSGNVLTKAIFYTGQQGYDLVGNNYTIKQREVNVNTALGSANFVKEYDGKYKLTESDVAGLFASTGESSGIVDADKDKVKIGFSGTLNSGADNAPIAVYKDSSGNIDNTNGDAGDVGLNKKVYVGGTLALTGNDKHNYKLVASTGDGVTVNQTTGAITIAKELTGTIYHKILKVGFNEQALNRQYDGTSVAKETVEANDFYLQDSKGNPVTNSADLKLVIDSSNDKAYFLDSNNGSGTGSYTTDAATYVGKHDVVFNGITLAGDKAKNYVLLDVNNPANVVYADSNTGYIHKVGDSYTNSGVPTNNGKWTTQGEITPRALSDYGFYWYDDVNDTTGSIASRQYNAGADFTYVDADNTNPIKGKIVNNNVTEGVVGLVTKDAGKVVFEVDSAEFIKSATDVNAGTATDVSGTNGAHGVRYKVKVKGADNLTDTEIGNILQNYEFGGKVLNTTNTYSLAGAGEITPRTIKIGAAAAADKPYDADAIVKTAKGNENNEFTLSYTENDGYLDYTGGNQYKLLDDGTQIIYTGAYQDTNGEGAANVNFDGEVKDKNITYTATIKGGNGNYVFENSTAVDSDNNPQITISNGKGKITQREITALTFKDAEKTFDGDATVNHDTIVIDTVTLYGGDTADKVFDLANVTGKYYSKGTTQENAHVENSGAAKSKDVIYSGIDTIVKNNNYKLGEGIGSTVSGEGAIKAVTLNDKNSLKLEKLHDITKVYDGNDKVKGLNATENDNDSDYYIGDLTYTLENGKEITLAIDSVHDAYYASADSKNGTAQKVTYELVVDDSGDYVLGSGLKTNGYLQWDGLQGNITKKDLFVSPLHDTVTKIYDGTTKVKVGNTVLVDDTAVKFDGWINVENRTKGAEANYINKIAADGKQVNYVINLDSESAGNYTIKAAQGYNLTGNTLVGTGDIKQATLHIEFAGKSKEYDGNADYTGTITPTLSVIDSQIEGTDDVSLDTTKYAAVFNSPNVSEANKITYTVELTGNDKDNYVIDPANSTTVANKTTIDGAGSITTKAVDNAVVEFKEISKVYDATASVAYDHTADNRYFEGEKGKAAANDYITSITVGGITLVYDVDYDIVSAVYDKAGVDASKATYEFELKGKTLSNYNLSGITGYDSTTHILTKEATNNVHIVPKQLQAAINNTALLEKEYNGTDNLPITAEEAAARITVTGFVNDNGDNTDFDGSKVNGRYVDRNVAYVDLNVPYDERIVTTKDVLFDVKLTGNGAGNYVINDTNSNSATLTGSDMGKITPKVLTVDFGYTEKTYNNKADAPVPADNDITLIGLPTVDNNLKLDRNTIVGQFGSKVGNEFKADGNVNYDETAEGKAGYKGVQYSNLRNAMETGFGTDANGYKIAGNYTIADTVYFAEAAQKGKIKRLALTMNDIEAGFKGDITKEYDGESAVSNPDNHFSVHTKAEKTGGQEIEFKLRHDDDWANYVDDTGNTQVNVVQGTELSYDNVVYKIKGLDADDILQNFDITGLTENSYAGTYTTKGSITPRVLKIKVTTPADGYAKTYDGTDKVKDISGNIINNFAYEYQTDKTSILEKDADTVKLAVTGAYDNANANKTLAGDTIQGQPDKKTIQYTVKLTSNDAGNYTLDAATHPAAGASTEVDSTTYTGQGDIKQRKVYVDFEDAINPDTGEKYGTKIDKQYNGGDTAADEAKKHRNHITFVGPEGDTGLVDTGLSLDTGNINANYVLAADSTTPDGNVARGDKGEVAPKYVHFTDFAFAGDNDLKNNYVIRAKDGKEWLTGSGTIKPIEVAVDITQAPVKDEYDGSTSVKAAYIANATNELNTDVAGTGVSINGVAASFDNANAGSASQNYGGKGYSYTFNMDNPNYELVAKSGSAHTVKTTGKNTDGSWKVTLHGNDGTIKPRTITPTVNGVMTKEYDGTPYGTENAEANVSLSNVLNGDMNKLGLSVVAVYDNPEAGVSEDSNELKKHVVTYTLNLTNHNYKLAKSSIEGTGTISRKGLTVVAKPASINSGEVMPAFSGTVEGFVSKDTGMASKFTFASMPTVTNASAGTNPVYGWYNNRISGNFGLNYTFSQAPANATAFTVNYVDSGHNNPDTKVTPTNNIYQQISKDTGSGFGDNAAAALEYVNKNGQVIGRENIDSGEIHDGSVSLGSADDMTSQDTSFANIGIVGGDVVNVDGVGAANQANIAVTDKGTTVNLEINSLSEGGATGDKQAAAEITDMPAASDNSSAQIQNLDGRQEIVEQLENKDKDEEKKESEIAIESKSSQNDDEIELKIEGSGVKVA